MKCKVLLALLMAGGVASAQQLTYENNGLVLAPPDIPPQIDATTFINAGRFLINFTNDLNTIPTFPPSAVSPIPFEMANVLNYTNLYGDLMSCNIGFRLEHFDTASGLRGRAANFHNAGTIESGTINTTNFALPPALAPWISTTQQLLISSIAGSKFTVAATNIINPGSINMG